MPNPTLIHPINVTVQRHNRAAQVMDNEAREPMHGARSRAADTVSLPAQISWGVKGRVQNEGGGVEEKSDGYILCRTSDLRAVGGPFKRGDKIVTIGSGLNAFTVELYLTETNPIAHWPDQGGPALIRFHFADRKPTTQTGDL